MGLKVAKVSCSVCGSATQNEQQILNCNQNGLELFTFVSHPRTAMYNIYIYMYIPSPGPLRPATLKPRFHAKGFLRFQRHDETNIVPT